MMNIAYISLVLAVWHFQMLSTLLLVTVAALFVFMLVNNYMLARRIRLRRENAVQAGRSLSVESATLNIDKNVKLRIV